MFNVRSKTKMQSVYSMPLVSMTNGWETGRVSSSFQSSNHQSSNHVHYIIQRIYNYHQFFCLTSVFSVVPQVKLVSQKPPY